MAVCFGLNSHLFNNRQYLKQGWDLNYTTQSIIDFVNQKLEELLALNYTKVELHDFVKEVINVDLRELFTVKVWRRAFERNILQDQQLYQDLFSFFEIILLIVHFFAEREDAAKAISKVEAVDVLKQVR